MGPGPLPSAAMMTSVTCRCVYHHGQNSPDAYETKRQEAKEWGPEYLYVL